MPLPRQMGIVIALLLLAPLQLQPQDVTQKSPEKQAAETEPYVIEQYDTRIRFENDGTGREELHVRSRVLTSEGAQRLSQLSFGYDRSSQQVEINSVVVHTPSGGSIEVLPGAVVDRPLEAVKEAPAYENAREKAVRVPALKPGDFLEYRVTTTITKPAAPGQFWFAHNFLRDPRAREESLEIDVPRDREVHLKTRREGVPPAAVVESEAGSGIPRRVYRWRVLQESAEPAKEMAAKKTAASAPNSGAADIQLTTFQSWEEVARWYSSQEKAGASVDEAVAAKAAELTRGTKENLERLEALYSFAALRIRTIALPLGALGYRSLPPGQVLKQGYGTPMDKHGLLAALAKSVGFPAGPMFLTPTHIVEEDVPSPGQFENVITAVQMGGEWIWLDTAPEVAPFRMLGSNLRNKRGFAPSGTAAGTESVPTESFRWLTTPADPPFPATQDVTVTAELNAAGKLTSRVAYALRGDAELLLRVTFHRTPKEQWKTIGLLLAFADGLRGTVSDVTPSDPTATADPFHLTFQVVQDHAVQWAEQKARLSFPLPVIGLPDLPENSPADRGEAHPLELGTALDIATRVTIALPQGVTPRAPFPVAVKRDYAEYRSTYHLEGNRAAATRDLRFLTRELPATRFADYAAFAHAVRNDEAQTVALERPAPRPKKPAAQKPSPAQAH
ncbi:MAG TPA: DUF3857 domain-containing protein [Candidatus Acidoferrales bacterium]|nr:DUF3857 domain-containing protein [Candidatus Acidoferrales bacterium]